MKGSPFLGYEQTALKLYKKRFHELSAKQVARCRTWYAMEKILEEARAQG